MTESKKMDEQQGVIDLGKLIFIAIRKVCSHNSSLFCYIPKKVRELVGFSKVDNIGWFVDPVTKWIILKKSEFRNPDFPPKTAQDSKEAEEEKNG